MPFVKSTSSAGITMARLPACLFVLVVLLLNGCKKTPNTGYVSTGYNKVMDTANHVYDMGKYQLAVNYLDSAAASYKTLSLSQKFDHFNFDCTFYFHVKKDDNRAMLYSDSMLNLYDTPRKRRENIGNYSRCFFYKGDILFDQKKFNEAYQYYYEGKLIASKDVNKCTLGDYSYRMGMIMYKQEHFDMAAVNFKAASNETATCDLTFPFFYRNQETLSNIGLSFTKINEPDSALIYFDKALRFINTQGKRFRERKNLLDVARGVIYGNEAGVFIQLKKYQLAKALLKKSSRINLGLGNDNNDAVLAELRLAHLYLTTAETDSMMNLLQTVRRQLDIIKNPDATEDWNFLMASYFIRKNDSKTALNYFVQYDALKDYIVNTKKALRDADIMQQIKRLEKENEFNSLKKDTRAEDIYLKIALVFGVMLLSIIFLILTNWRKSRINIKELGALNEKINSQNATLEEALIELKLSSQEKDRILRTVAHDLRNPVGGIASLTKAMEEDDYTAEQKEMISMIRETSDISLELINEILEVANNRADDFKKELVEINGLVSNCTELLRFKAAEKNQKIITELAAAPVELLISREKIWRVVSNLIGNAIKFSPLHSVIMVRVTNLEEDVQIAVKDDGIGIPENMKREIFNMFTEAKRRGTAGEKSFGLGLSICRQIVENHGGSIWFESNTGDGTTFFVRLPKLVPAHS